MQKKSVIPTYAGELFKTVQFIVTKNSQLREVSFEITKKTWAKNYPTHFSGGCRQRAQVKKNSKKFWEVCRRKEKKTVSLSITKSSKLQKKLIILRIIKNQDKLKKN